VELGIFLSGVVVMFMVGASVAFTIYEVRRSNPHAFAPRSQVEPNPDL